MTQHGHRKTSMKNQECFVNYTLMPLPGAKQLLKRIKKNSLGFLRDRQNPAKIPVVIFVLSNNLSEPLIYSFQYIFQGFLVCSR